MIKRIIKGITLYIIGILIVVNSALSQDVKVNEIQYISPKPGSKFIMPGNNIALRHSEKFDLNTVKKSLLEVKSAKKGAIGGILKLSDDDRTLIFKPFSSYQLGDKIQVTLNEGLRTESGIEIEPIQFHFEVVKKIIENSEYVFRSYDSSLFPLINTFGPLKNKVKKVENNLPEGFPGIQVNIFEENASNGYYFFAPYDEWGWYPETENFLTITDVFGTPVYYRKLQNYGHDLKIQPSGYLSFYSFHPFWKHMLMDSSYQFIDSFKMGNGYGYTDFHEFQLLENGHSFVMTYDSQLYPMDTVIPGGHPNAVVTGFVFQELDSDKEVVFQWRSWDHFLVTDAGPFVDLTDSIIDYVHGNSIEIESESSLLISSRNMDEITRIDRNSGDIIWRFGGKNNQFEFINDTLGFSLQHDGRRLDNGNITLFDNGSMHPDPKYSSGLEYEMDEINMTATLIKRLRSSPDIFGVVMGNEQWRSENSKVIGWGSGVPGISEIDENDNVVYEMEFEGVSYRAYLFPWETNYFSTSVDSLFFEVSLSDSLIKFIYITNGNEFEIEISSIYNHNTNFSSINEFPFIVPPGSVRPIKIKFKPDNIGIYNDLITINSDINSDTLIQRIAKQVFLFGEGTSSQSINHINKPQTLIYPNPVDKYLIVKFLQEKFTGTLTLFDVSGKCVIKQTIDSDNIIKLNLEHFPIGVYFVYLIERHNTGSHFYKIIKN